MATIIQDVRLFDGQDVHQRASILVEGGLITKVAIGAAIKAPAGAVVVDGKGKTLLPGLIDGHVHAQSPVLEQNILFGVTTVLDCFSLTDWMHPLRETAAGSNNLADIRSASVGITVPQGHPKNMIGPFFTRPFPTISSVEDVAPFVAERVKEGADYIKFVIDDGTALSISGMPTMTFEMAQAIVKEAHKHGKMAMCHALDHRAASLALDAGVDGLVHMFFDVPSAPELVARIAAAGIWVHSTLVSLGGLAGEQSGLNLISDTHAMGEVHKALHNNIACCWVPHKRGPASMANALSIARELHAAGVPIIAGTDACGIIGLGAVYGVSLHGELRYLVQAGMTPVEALRSATSVPASHFGLTNRGFVKEGLAADLLLVNGDPTTNIEESTRVDSVWRNGHLLDRAKAKAFVQQAVDAKALAAAEKRKQGGADVTTALLH